MGRNLQKKTMARELRKQGMSLNEIKNRVGVAKSTISIWVRDIALTEEQLKKLKNYGQKKAGQKAVQRGRERRLQYQQEGRDMARQNMQNSLFIGGCMLYWGEGAKSRHQLKFSNSDVSMQKFFISFIREFFPEVMITAAIHCYTDVHTYDVILNYWSQQLDLSKELFRKPQINNSPKSSSAFSANKQKLPYGTLHLKISNVETLQKIYGAIQELSGLDNETWANL